MASQDVRFSPDFFRRPTMAELLRRVQAIRAQGRAHPVIVAFCFSDELPLKACLEGCQEAGAVPVILATTNQVNMDGGYAGLTAAGFVDMVKGLAGEVGYDGPVVFGRDHGGPFIVASHKSRPRSEEMAWIKENIRLDLEAGFTCWHADGTTGRDDELEDGKLPVSVIAETTLELIRFCETERKRRNIGPIAYEAGSEEQQGGLTAPGSFDACLGLLQSGMEQEGLEEAGLDFMVAQTGTHMQLHYNEQDGAFELVQDGFRPGQVQVLDRVAQKYRSPRHAILFTQHYSDHITAADAAALRRFGAGKVNFGPEMTMPELRLLLQWEKKEREALQQHGSPEKASGFARTMLEHMDSRPQTWRPFVPAAAGFPQGGPESVFALEPEAREALLIFRGRYVKCLPRCRAAAGRLLENLAALEIEPHPARTIMDTVKEQTVLPRLEQFHMTHLLQTLSE